MSFLMREMVLEQETLLHLFRLQALQLLQGNAHHYSFSLRIIAFL